MSKTLIITAMKEEADHIIEEYSLKETKSLANIKIYENDKIALALAGIGKIQATIATTYLLENYEAKEIINIGIAGSLEGNKANIGDVFIVNKILQHDMYLPFEGKHLEYAKAKIEIDYKPKINGKHDFAIHYEAYTLTGDQFIDDAEKVKKLKENHDAQVVEMEAFAVASTAREYGLLNKCIFIKAISDGADTDAKEAHMDNLDFAMQNSLKVLREII